MKLSIYEIEDKPVGCGGMGEVYRGRDVAGNLVAVKKLRDELTADSNLRAFFHREVNILSQLDHPSIVKMYASFEHNSSLYLVMEYVEGETLDRLVKRRGRLTENEAAGLFSDILGGVGYLHGKGFVHRDIKPGNIMVRPDGSACLLDFGIVKDMKHSSGHTVNQIIGTDGYMSVEQAEGLSIDYRSDIYSLGCVLFYMLVGDHAIHKQSNDYDTRMSILSGSFPRARDIVGGISDGMQSVLDKATHRNMMKRFQSCAEFSGALGHRSICGYAPDTGPGAFAEEMGITGEDIPGHNVSSGNGAGSLDTGPQVVVTAGREGCEIMAGNPRVSRMHLEIRRRVSGDSVLYTFRDCSTNGTVVDGELIRGEEITIPVHGNGTHVNPVVLLAGEVELDWHEVLSAFRRKEAEVLPVSHAVAGPGRIGWHEVKEQGGKSAIGWVILLYVAIITSIILGNVISFGGAIACDVIAFFTALYVVNSRTLNDDGSQAPKFRHDDRQAAKTGLWLSALSVFVWIMIVNWM